MAARDRSGQEPAERIINAVAQHADKLSKITLSGGIVGRITWILIFQCLSTIGVAWSVKSEWVAMAGLLLMAGSVLYLGTRALKFAEENPQTALMEGAEILIHEQMKLQMGMKSQPVLDTKQIEDTIEPVKHPQLNAPQMVNRPDDVTGEGDTAASTEVDPGSAPPDGGRDAGAGGQAAPRPSESRGPRSRRKKD